MLEIFLRGDLSLCNVILPELYPFFLTNFSLFSLIAFSTNRCTSRTCKVYFDLKCDLMPGRTEEPEGFLQIFSSKTSQNLLPCTMPFISSKRHFSFKVTELCENAFLQSYGRGTQENKTRVLLYCRRLNMDYSLHFLQKYHPQVKSSIQICAELQHVEQCSENSLKEQDYWFDQHVANKAKGLKLI